MKVLVIDTALNACTAAVFDGDRPLGVRIEPMAKGHQERIGGFVRDAVAEAGGFEGVERIGVTVGPGSFTGLRVGLAFAQGLGAALGVPVVGISTLAGLAASALDIDASIAIVAAIDARRGQVYVQTFLDGVPTNAAAAIRIEDAFGIATEGHIASTVVGSGGPLILEPMLRGAPPPSSPDELDVRAPGFAPALITVPTPAALAALTIAADPATSPPAPLYLRAPDATPPTRLPGQARPAKPS